ncbi:hypothetical protein IIE18_21905 [Pseudomonas sp. V1]|uniref:hypothetical protein n=1 Tax=Pseudomonas arcuscaelestis TaxID=2710591 RepID=UPI00193F5D73|nr:hypothetical protein [Pseudomonas arcuscaelestis]MBM3107785.1 hypothetical protein [Pseudomonas arcuscaelestis]
MQADTTSAKLWLRTFKIELSSASNRVYRNGRQQIEIRLSVEPISGKTVTEEQLKTLTVVTQSADGSYQPLPELSEDWNSTANEPWFYSQKRDERFDYFSDTLKIKQPHLPNGQTEQAYSKLIYIQSSAAAGSVLTLRGCIQEDGENPETVYYTDKDDGFDIKVELITAAIPLYAFPENYIWRKIRSDGDSAAGARFIHEYSLQPYNAQFVYAEFSDADIKGMIRWQDHQPTQTYASHVGLAIPGSKEIHYNTDITLGSDFPARQVKEVNNAPNGVIIVLLQGDNQIKFNASDLKNGGPCSLSAYDKNGNEHYIQIAFDDSQGSPLARRTNLTVQSTTVQPASKRRANIANIVFFKVRGVGRDENNATCRLYRNGKQQTYVEVELQAVDDNNIPVEITPDILEKVKIVDYVSGDDLPSEYTFSATRSEIDEKFDLFPDTKAPVSPVTQPGQGQSFWIKTTSITQKQIAAELTHDGVTYHTYQKNLEPGGKTEAGKSNSSATILPVAQNYFFKAADFNLSRRDAKLLNRNGILKEVDEYLISFKSPNHSITYSETPTSLQDTSQNIIFTIDYTGSNTTNVLHYFRYDYSRTVNAGFHTAVFEININQNNGVAHAARAKLDMKFSSEYTDALKVHYIDQFGNSHPVFLHPGDVSNTLFLSDTDATKKTV